MVDLHIHTTYSDGTCSVKEILKQAESLKLDYISITDHDKCLAYEELKNIDIKNYYSGKIIKGIEIKCFYKGSTIEVLGYDYDYEKMNLWVKEFYAKKDRKVIETKYFNKLYDICEKLNLTMSKREDIVWNPENDWGGKTVYDEIKRHPENKSKLPEDFWDNGVQTFSKKYYCNKETEWYIDKSEDYPSVETAVNAIKSAGGLVFLPHIYIYKWMKNIEEELNELLEKYDIDGIECYHSDFTEENIKHLNELCDNKGFLKSGGSDYHGNNKPTISLAVGKGNLRIPNEIVNWYNK